MPFTGISITELNLEVSTQFALELIISLLTVILTGQEFLFILKSMTMQAAILRLLKQSLSRFHQMPLKGSVVKMLCAFSPNFGSKFHPIITKNLYLLNRLIIIPSCGENRNARVNSIPRTDAIAAATEASSQTAK